MPDTLTQAAPGGWLDSVASRRLFARLELARERARDHGTPWLTSVTTEVGADVDPVAAVAMSRRRTNPGSASNSPTATATRWPGSEPSAGSRLAVGIASTRSTPGGETC